MKPRRRRGRGAVVLGVDGLVAVFVLQFVRDIRRQGHFAEPVQDLLEDSLVFETNEAVSFIDDVRDLAGKNALAEDDPRPGPAFLAGLLRVNCQLVNCSSNSGISKLLFCSQTLG